MAHQNARPLLRWKQLQAQMLVTDLNKGYVTMTRQYLQASSL